MYAMRDEYILKVHDKVFYPYQREASDAIIKAALEFAGKDYYIEISRQSGKCLAKGTEVLMHDGTIKKVEEVVVGDLLMGEDSTPREVLSLCKGREELFTIQPVGAYAEPYTVNKSHILTVWNKRKKHLEDIPLTEFMKLSHWKRKELYQGYMPPISYPERKVFLDPYFLGLWLGDGANKDQRITSADKEVKDFLEQYAETLGHKLSVYKERGTLRSYSIAKKSLSESRKHNKAYSGLRKYDLLHNKHIPHDFLVNSEEVRLKVLAGLIDSDGHRPTSKGKENTCELVFKNKRLSQDIVRLARSLGIRACVKDKIACINSIGYSCRVYRVCLYGQLDRIPTLIPRKQYPVCKLYNNPLIYGFDVISEGIGEYYGFVIGGNKRFLLANNIVTHNTECIVLTLEFLILHINRLLEWLGRPLKGGFNTFLGAPQKEQAKTDLDRLQLNLSQVKNDFQIEYDESNGTTMRLAGSNNTVFCMPVNVTSHIESKTAHFIIMEEMQDVPDAEYQKKVLPMGTSCVCEGTLLIDKKAEYIDIVDVKGPVLGHEEGSDLLNEVANYGTYGLKKCVRLITNSGRTLECSRDHPILTKPRETRCLEYKDADATLGMQVAIKDSERAKWGSRELFDSRLVGMLIGDGSYRGKNTLVRYCSCDKELLSYVKKYGFKSYNSYYTQKGKLFEDGTLRGVTKYMKALGLQGQTGKAKRFPDIKGLSRDSLAKLIAGFFDTDGCVWLEEKRRARIKFSSCSELLLWDLFYALEMFGIHSRVYFTKAAKTGYGGVGCWNLVISERESVLRFVDSIPSIVGYKKELLEQAKTVLSSRKSKRQKNILGLYFERVVKIEDIGIQRVYNLTALRTNNYYANNILTHNTNASRVHIGTAGYKICQFYKGIESGKTGQVFKYDCFEVIKQKREAYERDGDLFHLNYEKYVEAQIKELGDENPQIRTQYFLEWQLEQGMFMTPKRFNGIVADGKEGRPNWAPVLEDKVSPCFVSLDVAKESDVSFLTVMRVEDFIEVKRKIPGLDENKNPCLKEVSVMAPRFRVLNYLMLKGILYQEQWEMIDRFLDNYNVFRFDIDSTGVGDATADYYLIRYNKWTWDILKEYERLGLRGTVKPVKFTAKSKHDMYVNWDIAITEKRYFVPNPELMNEQTLACFKRFKAEALNALREWKGNFLSVRHPDTSKGEQGDVYTDDSLDSAALPFHAIDEAPHKGSVGKRNEER